MAPTDCRWEVKRLVRISRESGRGIYKRSKVNDEQRRSKQRHEIRVAKEGEKDRVTKNEQGAVRFYMHRGDLQRGQGGKQREDAFKA